MRTLYLLLPLLIAATYPARADDFGSFDLKALREAAAAVPPAKARPVPARVRRPAPDPDEFLAAVAAAFEKAGSRFPRAWAGIAAVESGFGSHTPGGFNFFGQRARRGWMRWGSLDEAARWMVERWEQDLDSPPRDERAFVDALRRDGYNRERIDYTGRVLSVIDRMSD